MAWSSGLLGFNLIFALSYPAFAILINWMVSGNGEVGGSQVIPAEPNDLYRYATICGIAIALIAFMYAERPMKGPLELVIKLVSGGFLLWIAVEVAGTVAVAATVVIAVAGASAGAFAVAFAVAGAFASASAGAFAVTGATTFAFVGAYAVDFLVKKLSYRARFLFCWAIFGIFAIGFSIHYFDSLGNRAGFVLFISVLPIVNALADFASIGSTRFFLRRGAAGRFWLFAIYDIAVAVVIFAALGMSIIAIIHFVRPQNGVALLNLADLFKGLCDIPSDYWWLFFMLFSTVIPTVLHLVIAIVSAFTLAPAKWRNWIAENLAKGGEGAGKDFILEGRKGYLALSFSAALACFIPVFLIVEGFLRSEFVLKGIIGGFEGFARYIGAF